MRCNKLIKEPHNPFLRRCVYNALENGFCKLHDPEKVAKREHEKSRKVIFKAHGEDIGPYAPKEGM